MIFRPMKPEDSDVLDVLERICFVHSWPAGAFRDETENVLARYIIAEENGRIVGYGGMWLVLLEAQITNIAVHPDYRRQGIGRELVTRLMRLAWEEMGIVQVTLEARVGNQPARSLYEKLGFTLEGIRPKYYENTEDAAIYWNWDTRIALGVPIEDDKTEAE